MFRALKSAGLSRLSHFARRKMDDTKSYPDIAESEYTDFDGLVIPESIVEAFIQKIWVSKDEFRWYLRTNRSSSAEDAEHIQIGAFTLTLEDAKSYQYSFSTRKRIYNWEDLNVTVWI